MRCDAKTLNKKWHRPVFFCFHFILSPLSKISLQMAGIFSHGRCDININPFLSLLPFVLYLSEEKEESQFFSFYFKCIITNTGFFGDSQVRRLFQERPYSLQCVIISNVNRERDDDPFLYISILHTTLYILPTTFRHNNHFSENKQQEQQRQRQRTDTILTQLFTLWLKMALIYIHIHTQLLRSASRRCSFDIIIENNVC